MQKHVYGEIKLILRDYHLKLYYGWEIMKPFIWCGKPTHMEITTVSLPSFGPVDRIIIIRT